MSRQQFGYLAGFLFGWLLWAASFWVALGAVALGVLGFVVVRVIEGELDLGELGERFGSRRQ